MEKTVKIEIYTRIDGKTCFDLTRSDFTTIEIIGLLEQLKFRILLEMLEADKKL